MAQFVIHGGNPIGGVFKPVGNKNAALPMLAACLLTDQPVVLRNVPDILDVRVMLEILDELGVSVDYQPPVVRLHASHLKSARLSPELCRKVRTSILLAGPLLARCGCAHIYPPGGDVIGRRRLDTHFLVLQSLGAELEIFDDHYCFRSAGLRGRFILLDEASVTATENAIMAAVLAKGETVLYNVACEPHIHDLGNLLIQMGADIQGLGTNKLLIRGVEALGGADHTVGPDYVEIGSYVAAVAATGGQLKVELPKSEVLWEPIIQKGFHRLGVHWDMQPDSLIVSAQQSLVVQKDITSDIAKIEDGIWPAFPSDLMSVAIVLATQVAGTTLFFEKLFESRMYFVDNLISLGANIVVCDPHRVVVIGPGHLRGGIMNSPDIRAGMALLIAALCAEGRSVIRNVDMIDRGYEQIDARLRQLGASIEREE